MSYTRSWSYTEGLSSDDDILLKCRERAQQLGVETVSPSEGALLSLLASTCKARSAVEIGGSAGVAGIYLLRGLPSDAILTSIDPDTERLKAARSSFAEAGFGSNRTRIISGQAADVLPRLMDEAYDLVLISGDKARYSGYVEQATRLLHPGGILIVHDALDGGNVANPTVRGATTAMLRKVNRSIQENSQLISVVLPTSKGMLLASKIATVPSVPSSRS